MSVLMSTDIKRQIAEEAKSCNQTLQIITAFCKVKGLQFIESNIGVGVVEKRILVRFRMEDIISGATDLSIYEYAKQNNWIVYIRFDLHAKTYIFDRKRCILGSANLTGSGLQLFDSGNYEMANLFDIEPEDITKIDMLFNNAILLDDNLYLQMKKELGTVDRNEGKLYQWSEKIQKLFLPDYNTLFADDFPEFKNYLDYNNQPIGFLELKRNWDFECLQNAFRMCKAFLWLKSLVKENGYEMYFGEITANLHNALVKDPRPYRKDVKELLARLLQWIQDLEIDEVIIDRPQHSQRVRIVE